MIGIVLNTEKGTLESSLLMELLRKIIFWKKGHALCSVKVMKTTNLCTSGRQSTTRVMYSRKGLGWESDDLDKYKTSKGVIW